MQLIAILSSIAFITLLPSATYAATLTLVNSWGGNPASLTMHVYVPDDPVDDPPIVVALHGCGGSGPAFFNQTDLPSYADSEGFILIYPSTTKWSNCWEAHTLGSITHDGGSDSESIANMVAYAVTQYTADPAKVFAVGSSSGAMMATVLAAAYPDVFAGISGFSGAPVGCLYGSSGSSPPYANPDCLAGNQTYTTSQWGDFVTNAYTSWSSDWPKVQFWHGTSDTLILYGNFEELLDQWSDVHSVSYSSSVSNTPISGYTKLIYGDGSKLVGYSASGVGHPVPVHSVTVLQFFGIL